MIGMGAILLQGVVCEEKVLVAAGSVVPGGTHIPAGKLVAGNPARIIKDVPVAFEQSVRNGLETYKNLTTIYRESMVKIA